MFGAGLDAEDDDDDAANGGFRAAPAGLGGDSELEVSSPLVVGEASGKSSSKLDLPILIMDERLVSSLRSLDISNNSLLSGTDSRLSLPVDILRSPAANDLECVKEMSPSLPHLFS